MCNRFNNNFSCNNINLQCNNFINRCNNRCNNNTSIRIYNRCKCFINKIICLYINFRLHNNNNNFKISIRRNKEIVRLDECIDRKNNIIKWLQKWKIWFNNQLFEFFNKIEFFFLLCSKNETFLYDKLLIILESEKKKFQLLINYSSNYSNLSIKFNLFSDFNSRTRRFCMTDFWYILTINENHIKRNEITLSKVLIENRIRINRLTYVSNKILHDCIYFACDTFFIFFEFHSFSFSDFSQHSQIVSSFLNRFQCLSSDLDRACLVYLIWLNVIRSKTKIVS